MKNSLQRPTTWIALFAAIFLLTQDHLFLKWAPHPSFLGLPNWLYYLMGLHVLLVVAFYFFTKKYWR